eukprot:8537425-Alexandrium_andersonii.AAC.1
MSPPPPKLPRRYHSPQGQCRPTFPVRPIPSPNSPVQLQSRRKDQVAIQSPRQAPKRGLRRTARFSGKHPSDRAAAPR